MSNESREPVKIGEGNYAIISGIGYSEIEGKIVEHNSKSISTNPSENYVTIAVDGKYPVTEKDGKIYYPDLKAAGIEEEFTKE